MVDGGMGGLSTHGKESNQASRLPVPAVGNECSLPLKEAERRGGEGEQSLHGRVTLTLL